MPSAIELHYIPREFPVPPDVRPAGTLIRFPVIPETQKNALITLSMVRGTVTLYFPKPGATDVRISVKIDTYGSIRDEENRKIMPAVSLVQVKDGTFMYPKVEFAQNGEYPVLYRNTPLAILKRDGISQVEIADRTSPIDVLLNEEDTLYADLETPDGSTRVAFRDFTPGKYHHAAITFVQTGREYHANYDQVRAIKSQTGETLCVVQIL